MRVSGVSLAVGPLVLLGCGVLGGGVIGWRVAQHRASQLGGEAVWQQLVDDPDVATMEFQYRYPNRSMLPDRGPADDDMRELGRLIHEGWRVHATLAMPESGTGGSATVFLWRER